MCSLPIFIPTCPFSLPRSSQSHTLPPPPKCVHRPPPSSSPQFPTPPRLLLAAFLSALTISLPTYALTDSQKLVAEAWRLVDQSYVDRTFNHHDWFSIRMKSVKKAYTSTQEAYAAIRNMLSLLGDPYTRFLTPQQYSSLTSSATGEVAGVGVEMFPARIDHMLKVTAPVDDSPAQRAGIRPADVILLIDGETTDSLTPDEAAARIRGSPGTTVSLTVLHDGGKEEELHMVRESLKLKTIKVSQLEGEVLYIKIKQFSSGTAEDMKEALKKIRGEINRVVLDLRNNPGGYFPAGVDVARLFVKSGTPIVYVVDKNGVKDEIDAVADGVLMQQPIVVLVNGATASASEILAAALKDNGRALLIGEKTFGKGVVQTVSQLSDGSGLAVTVARYETPSHTNINKVGIVPDVEAACAVTAEVQTCIPDSAWRNSVKGSKSGDG